MECKATRTQETKEWFVGHRLTEARAGEILPEPSVAELRAGEETSSWIEADCSLPPSVLPPFASGN